MFDMKEIAVYSIDSQGLVKYHGVEEWASRNQLLEYYHQDTATPRKASMQGWQHPFVTWYGNIGFGEVE